MLAAFIFASTDFVDNNLILTKTKLQNYMKRIYVISDSTYPSEYDITIARTIRTLANTEFQESVVCKVFSHLSAAMLFSLTQLRIDGAAARAVSTLT
jgi:hypothetical protein